MSISEQTKLILSITKSYRDAAGFLMDEALSRVEAEAMSGAEFQEFRATCYEPILGEAINLRNKYDVALSEALDSHIGELEKQTKKLKSALKKAKNVEKIVGFAGKVLAAVVATAAFVGAPTPASGAAAAATIGAAIAAVPSGD